MRRIVKGILRFPAVFPRSAAEVAAIVNLAKIKSLY
jgi:hypothetical protein